MPKCPMCLAGMPSSCLTGSCESTTERPLQETPSPTLLGIEITDAEDNAEEHDSGPSRRGSSRRRSRRTGSDSQSSGRKDAARRYPLDPNAPCEWAGKANCGGYNSPILGCLEGKQQARHHGPDKSVQNNEEGNVHRICHYCHYRWHAANDPTYDWNAGIYEPHNPRPLNNSERNYVIVDYMRYLNSGKRKKAEALD